MKETRRHFLKRCVEGAIPLLCPVGLLPGCSFGSREEEATVSFKGWAYEPDLVQDNLDRFRRLHSDIEVHYEAVSGNYHDKLVAMFVAKSALDCCYVRDDDFGEWVAAGWLRPIDDLPGIEDHRKDLFDYNLDAMSYDGAQYGLPYYTDFSIWVYNERMLNDAGLDKPGKTLEEIAEQAIKIKEKGIVSFPIILGYKQNPTGFLDWWAMNYASEVRLFDDELNPVLHEEPKAERILRWIVDGIHQHKIIDISSIETSLVRDNMGAGLHAFVSINKYDLQRLNDPTLSRIAGQAKMSIYPSLEPDQNGTMGWTRMYCLTSSCRNVEHAWKVIQYLGGKDDEGEYYTAKRWYFLKGLGFAYKSLMDDEEVIASTNQWADIDLIREQAKYARIREPIKASWFPDFTAFYQPEIQKVLMKEQTPKQGLVRIAKYVEKLKKEWEE